MVTLVTHGIKISVLTDYQEEYSKPEQLFYLFSYRISIENKSEFAVQLLRRHWHIFDSSGEYREVEGEGVIGEKPKLYPAEIYDYESTCNLSSEIGKMKGTYLMERQTDKALFKIRIPEFELIVPHRLN